MNPYCFSLALSYFNTKQEKYSLSELRELLGYTSHQLEILLLELQKNGYIAYLDNMLMITVLGRSYLIANNQLSTNLMDAEIEMNHIHKEQAVPIDRPYVPHSFYKKTDR